MKNRIVLLSLITCLAFVDAFGQNNWKQVSPTSFNIGFDRLVKGPGKQLLALGYQDQNIFTQDGQNWKNTTLNANPNDYLTFATYASESVVYAGYNNSSSGSYSLRKSTNGGRNWISVQDTNRFNEMSFVSGTQIGYGICGDQTNRFLKKTTNLGNTWVMVANIPPYYSNLVANSPTDLWAIYYGDVFRSTNGGLNWNLSSLGSQVYINSISMIGQFGFAYSTYKIYKTNNGGSSWTEINFPNSYIQTVFFKDELEGWIVNYDQNYKLQKTTNGGLSWQVLNPNSGYGPYFFHDSNLGWTLGNQRRIQTTENGGVTWQSPSKVTGEDLSNCAFQGKRAWVGGNNILAFSDNKGKSWTKSQFSDTLGKILEIKFRDSLNGIVVGNKKLIRTTDGGASWEKRTLPGLIKISSRFTNENLGSLITNDALYLTSDGGQNWVLNTMPSASLFGQNAGYLPIDVQMLDQNKGYLGVKVYDTGGGGPNPPVFAVGFNVLYKTQNGGSTWQMVNSFVPGYHNLTKIEFLNDQAGIIYREWDDTLQVTNNGGNSISKAKITGPGFWSRIRNIRYLKDTLCYALMVDGGSSIFRSNNGGLSWNLYDKVEPLGWDSIQNRGFEFVNDKPVLGVSTAGKICVNREWSEIKQLFATGRIVKKKNSDCIQDENEKPLSGKVFRYSPGLYYASSDDSGRYILPIDTGSGFIHQIINNFWFDRFENQFCPPPNTSLPIVAGPNDDTLKNFNFINDQKECGILVLNQTHWAMRPCRKSSMYIQVWNSGNIVSDSNWVTVKFPKNLHFLSANQIYDYNAIDSTYRFKIKPLQPNDGIYISIVDSVACLPNQLTGRTLCVKATIPNAPNCLLQSPNWDGADLEVASSCLASGQTRFKINNKGAAMSQTAQYQIFIDAALVYQAPFQLAANGAMTVTLPTNTPAGFARLEVPQSAFHPLSTFASAEANCATGASTNGMFPPPDQSPLVDIECVTVTNAYDPNDKQVFPTGWGTAGNVLPETEFKYIIRFQNTGTDTAFKVVLVDSLDDNLDIASLQIGNASHLYQFKVSGKGKPVLTWTFDNILLPDSGRNQEASNGFVSFSIRPKTGLALGTRLENFADIYFDFNDPIRTNTTLNTLWKPTLTTGVLDTVFVTEAKKSITGKSFKISPNPAVDLIAIQLPEGNTAGLEITDLQGKRIKQLQIISGEAVSIKDLSPGIYIMKLEGYRAERLVVKP